MDACHNDLVAGSATNAPQHHVGYSWPTGGLYANWILVNTTDKASFSGEAVGYPQPKQQLACVCSG